MLSDFSISLFGRAITITSTEQFLALILLAVLVTGWVLQQFRRRRFVVIQKSAVSDQAVYELSRIADAIELIARRQVEQPRSAAIVEQPPPPAKVEQSEPAGRIPFSTFGR